MRGSGIDSNPEPRGTLEVVLQNPNRYPEVSARRLRPWLERLTSALAERELAPGAAAVSLGVRFASDREMRRVNRGYRGKDKATDVLSFPGAAETVEEAFHLGDLLISIPTARRQAEAHGHSAEREIKVLLLHGLLHCLGYDHETDQGEMERLERRLRRTWIGEDDA
ncbi:MAG TPA: rRNA maturation RNase YbeY [Thermoanaerobaculia bacterium]|nr:rRNA maturation RNase YbeY [Thermoanaerobaculia bacterium]